MSNLDLHSTMQKLFICAADVRALFESENLYAKVEFENNRACLEKRCNETTSEFRLIAQRATKKELFDALSFVIGQEFDSALRKARSDSNDWRTTARQLGAADGFEGSKWFVDELRDALSDF